MAVCSLSGSFADLRIVREKGATLYRGDTWKVDFFGDLLPELAGDLAIYSETYERQTSDDLDGFLHEALRERAERLAAWKSGVWLGTYEHLGKRYYHADIMLSEPEFEFFSRTVDRHFGNDVIFDLSFEYPPFESWENNASSKDAFLEGKKKLVLQNPAIEITFSPGAAVRKREDQR